MSTSDELRIGVIGVGGRGGLAWLAHDPDNGSRVVAGADVRDEALAKFKEAYGPDVFMTSDYADLLADADVDVVFVASPDFCHEEHAVAALRAGKAVYLEKPMAITIAGCDHILRAAFETGSKLYLGHNMRHFAVMKKMKELIDAGSIGEVKAGWCRHFVSYGGGAYFKDWHADRTKSNGLLLQKGVHDIDILHWLCGGYTDRVNAMGGLTLYDQITDRHSGEYGHATCGLEEWPPLSMKQLHPIIDVEDINMMLMHLDNGVFASYQQCHYTPDAWRNYTIIGTEGRIENCGDLSGESVVKLWNRKQYYNPYGDMQYFVPREQGSHGGSDPRIVAEFIRYVREGGAISTSPVAAWYSVAAACAATESVRNGGQPMDVPELDDEVQAHFGRS